MLGNELNVPPRYVVSGLLLWKGILWRGTTPLSNGPVLH